jgi:hypothetical protein
MPTGTLANHIALRVLARGRSRVIVQDVSHVYNDTGDGCQVLSNLNLIPVAPGKATFTRDDVERVLARTASGRVAAQVGAISIESPIRRLRGELFDLGEMKRTAFARSRDTPPFDGATPFPASARSPASRRSVTPRRRHGLASRCELTQRDERGQRPDRPTTACSTCGGVRGACNAGRCGRRPPRAEVSTVRCRGQLAAIRLRVDPRRVERIPAARTSLCESAAARSATAPADRIHAPSQSRWIMARAAAGRMNLTPDRCRAAEAFNAPRRGGQTTWRM